MASLADVRRIALAFPGVEEQARTQGGGIGWRVKQGLVVWERTPSGRDLEQLAEQGDAWPDGVVVAVRTDDTGTAEALIASDPDVYFTIPHFAGYPAVLVRLDAIDEVRLAETVADGWLARVPQRVRAAWLTEYPPD